MAEADADAAFVPPSAYAADLASVRAAAARIAEHAVVTPVLTSPELDALLGRALHFKCEVFQRGGAFKFRGACNAVLALPEEQAARGVVTHSSGNHAGALALAASLRGIPAHIVLPRNAPLCKAEALRRLPCAVTLCQPTVSARVSTAEVIAARTGAVMIPPFNYGPVISGQGTIALEFLKQVPSLDVIIAPISGGGLISGIAVAAKALKPSIMILAAEPAGADDAFQSKARGSLLPCPDPRTIADGLRASMASLTWPVVRDLVDGVIRVEEEEILAAMKLCFGRLKVVVEPSGAVGLAAVLSDAFLKDGRYAGLHNVGIILCGGNLDLEPLWASIGQDIGRLRVVALGALGATTTTD
eukprot:SM000255S08777  [mRNA]  locus=s255:13074:15321:- [translate_table: standard]